MSEDKPYKMSLSLNVLNHLGLTLYSNIPAVLSEVVANAWDADAEVVDVEIDADNNKIVISDDGHGMSLEDINSKYLHVGYRRRDNPEECITPHFNRPVMGRKGIGKLSLFSIAQTVEIYTVKNGERHGFLMVLKDIQDKIKDKEGGDTYYPRPISVSDKDIYKGTKIVLTDLKKTLHLAVLALRKRLARRFSIIGEEHRFKVNINGELIGIADRDYFYKLQHIWYYGDDSEKYAKQTTKATADQRSPKLPESEFRISGWIGTVENAGDLKDGNENLNKIVLMVRGKLAQEDILEDFNEGGLYSKYLIGEIHADFLDLDKEEDIATSNRQRIIESDPRYEALKKFIYQELKQIQGSWDDLRDKAGVKKALEHPAIKEWFKELPSDAKKRARKLFGKINRLTIDSPEEKRRLLKYGILAFESLRYKGNLDALENISPENLDALIEIFASLDDIEATLYHQIVSERVEVIKVLQEKVEENAREKAIQQHLFTHLWLLDPSWERATETPIMEQRVETEFGEIDADLKDEERKGRVDIKYKTASGKHIIVELKRADRKMKDTGIVDQLDKYKNALARVLEEVGRDTEPIECVCVVGRKLTNWSDSRSRKESEDMLKAKHIRVVLYQELIDNAYKSYQKYLEKSQEAGRISQILKSLDDDDLLL